MYQGNYLASTLRRASLGRERAVFLTDHQTGRSMSYGDFFANAERMANALVALGVTPGDRVAVQTPKTVAMLELYIGCVLAGAVFLPLNPAYTAAEISYFLDDARPTLFVCDPAKHSSLDPVAASCGVTHILDLSPEETGSLIAARDAQNAGFEAVDRAPLDLAAILYTSGTTGRSKGAMLTHRALASNSLTLRDHWRFTSDDVLIHALPIFHTHGLFVATNITLMAGGALHFMQGFDPQAIIDTMPRATALMGVPTFYTRLLDTPGLADASKGMRLFVSGSAPLLAETHVRWAETTGHGILERYGMTETNMNTSNPYDGERRAGTVGFALPGVELKVCDADGSPLPQGEIGTLEVRGDNVFAGYWQMPEKTAEELREDGFFITGDLGKIDEDGYVHIVGRGKDLIITGGFNVYPKEIESLIDDIPEVLESAVIGVPHADFGEAVIAIVVPQRGLSLDIDKLKTQCSHELAKFKQPKQIILLEELPRNTMGKVQKNALRETYRALFS
ncbi:malonate--CoA ligase [Cochlodiniinecator piscidefendens]|uniref:malonate--CoA ligase n=1 Tax=Cochlodiniinecator piscidefendens TaxID=2715756 RepID=UPI00140BEBAC|nr:malonyl-CoA synthase [Cochlodiniinecator piscidefendens]